MKISQNERSERRKHAKNQLSSILQSGRVAECRSPPASLVSHGGDFSGNSRYSRCDDISLKMKKLGEWFRNRKDGETFNNKFSPYSPEETNCSESFIGNEQSPGPTSSRLYTEYLEKQVNEMRNERDKYMTPPPAVIGGRGFMQENMESSIAKKNDIEEDSVNEKSQPLL